MCDVPKKPERERERERERRSECMALGSSRTSAKKKESELCEK